MTTDILTQMWADYVFEDRMDPRVRPEIADAWRRCKEAGVNPAGGEGKGVDEEVYSSILAANRQLIDTALPIMQSVFEIVKKSHYLLVLTDSVGYILETMGDEDIYTRSEHMRFTKGALWNGRTVGANAISVALDYDIPIQMAGAEHYCRSHHDWTCSAAPIHGLNGEVIGCINLSGGEPTAHDHTLGLALSAAYGIEGQLKLKHNAEIMQSVLEGSADSIFLIGEDYRAFWMNSAAKKLTGMSLEELQDCDFRGILPDVEWSRSMWNGGQRCFSDDTRVALKNGQRHCSAAISYLANYGTAALSVTLKKQKHLINAVNKLSGNRASYSFEDIYTQDKAMLKTLSLAKKYADYDGNILIEGESGTGKELMAQAIHLSGRRADGPFVTVNCASIPREMLEAELFGYESGAFGGKSSDGSPGRFELAQHGTLFLDEVSEMPMEFQSRLLRVVESHSVTRIGGAGDISLDIRIVASTNRKLDKLMQSGRFRGDLYHRLNVLRLDIPPLRSRPGDISLCAQRFLARLNAAYPEQRKDVSPEFLAGLAEYDWPGNVRELQNGIERAFYSEPGRILDGRSLRFALDKPPKETEARDGGEAGALMAALTLSGGDVEQAAGRLGISRATLYRKLKKYDIDPKSLK